MARKENQEIEELCAVERNESVRPSTSLGRKDGAKLKQTKKKKTMQYSDKLTGLMGIEREQLAQQILIASEKGNKKAVYLLLHQGIERGHCIGMQGYTPLHHAASRGHLEIAQLLLQFGWLINQTNKFGETALHLACYSGHFTIAEFLLDKGAEINALNNDRENALFYASRKGHFRLVRLLLRRDINWKLKNRFDDTAEDEAKDKLTCQEFALGKDEQERLQISRDQRPAAQRTTENQLQTKHREHIFTFLNLRELSRALQVCYRWQRAADAPRLWANFKVSRWELSLNKSLGLGVVAPMSGYRPKQTIKPRPSTSGAEIFSCALGFQGIPKYQTTLSPASSSKIDIQRNRRPQTANIFLNSPRYLSR
ncbi:F-box protein [Thraustotheca clavata]|uniref:F-box protein n=1 Tax=Thraustotheca clavata TaxID=74557 RepID=A0A1V9YS09_9STRA|nr:F-box protein [Thraustotheca clavata]